MPLPAGLEGNDHNYIAGDPYPEKEVHKLISSVVYSDDRITAKEDCLRDLLGIYVIAKIELSKVSEKPLEEGRQGYRWAEKIEVFINKVLDYQEESGLDGGFEIKLEPDKALKEKQSYSLYIPVYLKQSIWDYIVKETANFPPVKGEETPGSTKNEKNIIHFIVRRIHNYLTGEHSLGPDQSDQIISELTQKKPFKCLGILPRSTVRGIRRDR